MTDLLSLAEEVEQAEGPFVLVSLVSVKGSTYRKPGARLLVSKERTYGLMSGGCLESEIAKRCSPLLEGFQQFLRFELDTRQHLGCDGRLDLWCEVVDEGFLSELRVLARSREPRVCNTYPGSERDSELAETADPKAFSQDLAPLRRLLVFGSAPDAQPLLALAQALRWKSEQVVLSSDPVSGSLESVVVLANASQLPKLSIDQSTACVVMNHHFGRDLELLRALWGSPTPYLGLLGSRKRRDQLLEELAFKQEATIDLESRQLYAPVGLNLGAEGPYEIALEVCAQVQQVMSSAVIVTA